MTSETRAPLTQMQINALNEFAKGRMEGDLYTPTNILVDLRFFKDWMVPAVIMFATRDNRNAEHLKYVSQIVTENATSKAYQEREFDDPQLLLKDCPGLSYSALMDYISSMSNHEQFALLVLSPDTTFAKVIAGRTIVNLFHSEVSEKSDTITHTINTFPLRNTEMVFRTLRKFTHSLLRTSFDIVRIDIATAPFSVFKGFDHVYVFEAAAFLKRKEYMDVFQTLTTEVTRRWSFADVYGNVFVPNAEERVRKDRANLTSIMQTMTEFETLAPTLFLPIFPETEITEVVTDPDE